MPAHIYIRVGRYADAAEANVRAIAADEDYLAQCQAQGLYPVSYYPHNLHFLWAAATFDGRRAVAVDAARKVAEKVPHHHAGALSWTADFPVTPLLAYARFGLWQDVLTEPKPPVNQPYAIGIWHYGRGLAFVARARLDAASQRTGCTRRGHEARGVCHDAEGSAAPDQSPNRFAHSRWRAQHAAGQRRCRRCVAREAVTIEDGIPYSEPPIWHHPPRQILGAILLEAGRAAEAEAVYREDLKRFRENGWSLFGLARSLEAQQRASEAAEARQRFEKAWARADIQLTSSRIMDAGGALSSTQSNDQRASSTPSPERAGQPRP